MAAALGIAAGTASAPDCLNELRQTAQLLGWDVSVCQDGYTVLADGIRVNDDDID